MSRELKKSITIILLLYVGLRFGWLVWANSNNSVQVSKVGVQVAQKDISNEKNLQQESEKMLPLSEIIKEDVAFAVNTPRVFNGMTRQEIYDLRKKFVDNSPFYPKNYEPSAAVFGGIVDGKPWYGANSRPCSVNKMADNIKGDTLLSPIVNNPNALVSIFSIASHTKVDVNSSFCKAHHNYIFTPTAITYKVADNTLEIRYRLNDTLTGNNIYKKPHDLQITGINARDAGFEYVTATNFKGGYFFDRVWVGGQLVDNPNVAGGIYKFADFIHLGWSCGYEGGCNNISPRQTHFEFGLKTFPAQIDLKLWRKRPAHREDKADLNCKIIFE